MRFILCFLILLIAVPLLADVDPRVCFKVNINLSNGKQKTGYLHAITSLWKDHNQYYYTNHLQQMKLRTRGDTTSGIQVDETDYHFHRHILSIQQETIQLFSDIVIVNASPEQKHPTPIPAYLGTPDQIRKTDVADLTVQLFFICDYGFIVPNLSIEDSLWLESELTTKIEALGGLEICHYSALCPGTLSSKASQLLGEFRAVCQSTSNNNTVNDYDQTSKRISELAEKLRLEKVILIAWCSC